MEGSGMPVKAEKGAESRMRDGQTLAKAGFGPLMPGMEADA